MEEVQKKFQSAMGLPMLQTELYSNSLKVTFKIFLIIQLFLLLLARAKVMNGDSDFSAFCEDEVFFKPYVRIREGRDGPMIKDSGPGFIELTGLEDLYVCANGLVFLYFKIVRMYGQVYDEAVMQYASHYCGFYNGKPGPGMDERDVSLFAILLIGNSNDYRKIAVQMFYAPWYNTSTYRPMNYTSLAIINTEGECILKKGKERANIRIKANPPTNETKPKEEEGENKNSMEEEDFITICKLDVNILLNSPDKVPIDTELASTKEVLSALRLTDSGPLSLMGCWEYPLLDPKQFTIIEERLNESKDESGRVDKSNSELNPEDGSTLKFWTEARLEKYGSPVKEVDNSSLKSDVEAKNTSYHEELAKPHDQKDKERIKETREEYELAVLKLKLMPHYEQYKKLFDLAKETGEKSEESWTKVFEAVSDEEVQKGRENYTKCLTKMAEIPNEKRLNPYDKRLNQKWEELQKEVKDYYKSLKAKTLEIGPLITVAEVSAARHKSYKLQLKNQMDKIKSFILEFEKHHKVPKKGIDEVQAQEMAVDMLISLKNTGEGSGDNAACLNFERRTDQCKTAKPNPERACKIALDSVGGGGGNSSGGEWPNGEADKWRDEVFELLENIFEKVCPYLDSGFATSVNRIVRGYLMKKPNGTGLPNETMPGAPMIPKILYNYVSNYQIKDEADLFPPLKPKDDGIWAPIIDGLKKCETETNPLKFDLVGMRPLKLAVNGKSITLNREKADMEFAFNWAVDANFKIFATVLGACIKELGDDVVKKFYKVYSEEFLDPIQPIWLSNRDNAIFNVILGRYTVSGKGNLWTSYCLEASFVNSGKGGMRPLRKLFVNSYTEPNYFVDGPLKDERGAYA